MIEGRGYEDIVTCHTFHKLRGWNKLAKVPFDSTGRLLSVLIFRCQVEIDEKGPKLINNSNVRPCLAFPLSACAHQVRRLQAQQGLDAHRQRSTMEP